MFVVMKIQDFDFEAKGLPIPVKIDAGKMIGYLPVYETREQALEDFPGSQVVGIRYKLQPEEPFIYWDDLPKVP